MAAAVLKSFDLDEIIFYYEAHLLPPGHPEAQICNKLFWAGVTHPCLPASAALSIDNHSLHDAAHHPENMKI
jgi:hypothetical protein